MLKYKYLASFSGKVTWECKISCMVRCRGSCSFILQYQSFQTLRYTMMSYPLSLPCSSHTHSSLNTNIAMNMATASSASASLCFPSHIIKKPLGSSSLHKSFAKSNASTSTLTCKASSSSSSSVIDFDLYELLGIDSSCDQSEVKGAYRNLQKRCHPDIAGPSGHDMAIILNEAYAILSDPNARHAYDKVFSLLQFMLRLIYCQ